MRLGNSDAPETPLPDARPLVAYVEPGAPATITNPTNETETRPLEPTPNMFRSSGTETRDARRQIAFFSRTSEGYPLSGGDHANGLHAVIARQANGVPQGQQTAWPIAQRSTLFRPPEPWDAGASRATPAANG